MDDLANLCVFLMNNYSGDETVNAGTGKELTIKELTEMVAKVIPGRACRHCKRFAVVAMLLGINCNEIARILTEKQRKDLKGNVDWSGAKVRSLPFNERRWGGHEPHDHA